MKAISLGDMNTTIEVGALIFTPMYNHHLLTISKRLSALDRFHSKQNTL
jgi:hypothetical protein